MKALTLYQPHASAMAIGLKTIETRGWKVSYRGPVVIHAARKCTREMAAKFAAHLHAQKSDSAIFAGHGYSVFGQLPFGQTVAIGDLIDVVPVETLIADGRATLTEQRWGDYTPGRFGWIFANVRRLERPRHVGGAQGLWEWKHGDIEVTDTAPSADRVPVLSAYRLPTAIKRPPFSTAPVTA